MHIAVAGNIGSGKTTLTRMLAEHYGWIPRFESVTFNPYLEDYYKDIQRWSFPLEVYFLKERFRDVLEIAKTDKVIIQDRSIFEGVYIFAANNKSMGNMTDRDFETFMNLFELMVKVTKTPDLMIYLRSSIQHLVEQIQKRGRDYEQGMKIEYLQKLNDRYEDFIENKYPGKVMIIEADNIDYLNNPADFASITDRIDALFYGLFPERIPFEK
ncbi:MAG: deoxynucleoside kinase [Prevotellaceae bacterium]|nr:deoxynucleoside kinase [Prevotellaceae bacterium]